MTLPLATSPISQIVELELWYLGSEVKHTVDVDCNEYVQVLNTGMFDTRELKKVRVMQVTEAELGTCYFEVSFPEGSWSVTE